MKIDLYSHCLCACAFMAACSSVYLCLHGSVFIAFFRFIAVRVCACVCVSVFQGQNHLMSAAALRR